MLSGGEPVVKALRQRMAHLVGYPEGALEPLQGVRYVPGQFYKPHHDYYNACETWLVPPPPLEPQPLLSSPLLAAPRGPASGPRGGRTATATLPF